MSHINDVKAVTNVITKSGFAIRHSYARECKNPILQDFDDLNLSQKSIDFWKKRGYVQMWSHQKRAIELAMGGANICISTSTSSGKTEIFQTIAIETLTRRQGSKVLAVYSAKALNRQQEERWRSTDFHIGKIDGDDRDTDRRIETLRNSDIVVMTPDVIHAFLMRNVNNNRYGEAIRQFISNVDLIIIDEIHLYRGVFGSNSAYLFRRFNNLRRIYRNDLTFPQYVTASATLPNPAEHSSIITGAGEFKNIGIELDGSPTAETTFVYVEKRDHEDLRLSGAIANLVANLTTIDGAKSITFTNGRQQAGSYAMDSCENLASLNLEDRKIYPFRAGGERNAREQILTAMENEDFNGIISTSALEIGIDVSGLNICILANIPYDLNSYYQRIGRVGRGGVDNKSYVIIVNDESIAARILFEDKEFDITKVLPDLEPALHLDNKNVIYLHAAMHVDARGGNSELTEAQIRNLLPSLNQYFNESFCDLFRKIQTGQEPDDYRHLVESLPQHYNISLRNMGDNYRILEGDEEKDEVTRRQLYNEAYVGAVRNAFGINTNGNVNGYYQRVCRIDRALRHIQVEKCNSGTVTRPCRRTYLYPILTNSSIEKIFNYGNTYILNTVLMEVPTIYGYTYEVYGRSNYIRYDRPFKDPHYTTGILFFNQALNAQNVEKDQIANIFYHAFVMRKRFERTDIEKGCGKLSYSFPIRNLNVSVQDNYIAIYDANKLNITSELMNKEVIAQTFSFLRSNITHFVETLFQGSINQETRTAILQICDDICDKPLNEPSLDDAPDTITVFAISSKAMLEIVNEETGEPNFLECMVVGVGKVANLENVVDYNVICLDSNELHKNVEMTHLGRTEDSIFAEYDWNNGIFINN